MKHEGGPHRVQRVPVTESQGRIHTSSATVTVLPEAEEVEVDIDPNDLQIDVYRSSGPGGQSVNTTDSAVRITHKPTGLVVAMQDEKSQIQNRAKALQVLRSRLLKLEQDRQAAELSDARKGQVGGGGRSEKIRTYNFKENRVTDHRIGLTLYKLDKVLAGELDEVIDALVADEQTRRPQRERSDAALARTCATSLARAGGRRASTTPTQEVRWIVEQASGLTGGRAGVAARRRWPTSGRPPPSTRWSAGGRRGSRCSTCSASWGFRTLDLLVDRAGADPAAGDRGGRRARHRRGAASGGRVGRPRHRLGRDRPVARRRALARRRGVGHRRVGRRAGRRPGQPRRPRPPGRGGAPGRGRLVRRAARRAARRRSTSSWPTRPTCPTARCSPARWRDWEPAAALVRRRRRARGHSSAIVAEAPDLAAARRRARGRDRRDQGDAVRRPGPTRPASPRSPSTRTSPAATAPSSPALVLTDASMAAPLHRRRRPTIPTASSTRSWRRCSPGEVVVLPTDTVYGLAALAGRRGGHGRSCSTLKGRADGDADRGAVRRRAPGGGRWSTRRTRRSSAAVRRALVAGPADAGAAAAGRASSSTSASRTTTVGVRVPDHPARAHGRRAGRAARRHQRQPPRRADRPSRPRRRCWRSARACAVVVDGGPLEGRASTVVDTTHAPLARPPRGPAPRRRDRRHRPDPACSDARHGSAERRRVDWSACEPIAGLRRSGFMTRSGYDRSKAPSGRRSALRPAELLGDQRLRAGRRRSWCPRPAGRRPAGRRPGRSRAAVAVVHARSTTRRRSGRRAPRRASRRGRASTSACGRRGGTAWPGGSVL